MPQSSGHLHTDDYKGDFSFKSFQTISIVNLFQEYSANTLCWFVLFFFPFAYYQVCSCQSLPTVGDQLDQLV